MNVLNYNDLRYGKFSYIGDDFTYTIEKIDNRMNEVVLTASPIILIKIIRRITKMSQECILSYDKRVELFLSHAVRFEVGDILEFIHNRGKEFEVMRIGTSTINRGIFGLERTHCFYYLRDIQTNKISTTQQARWNTLGELFSALYALKRNGNILYCAVGGN